MQQITPRWEWRAFGRRFREAEARLATLTPEGAPASDKIYLLSAAGGNVKVRNALVDIKVLKQVNAQGVEQWMPIMKAAFPLAAAETAQLFDTLGLAGPRVPLPSEDAGAVTHVVRGLGLGGYANTSYPRGLAALIDRAVRCACNRGRLADRFQEEGRLAYLAARSGLALAPGSLVLFDSGGGRTQFAFGHDSSVGQRFSLEVGSARYRALQARGHRAGRRAANSFRSHFGRPVTDRGPRRFPPHWLRWAAQ